MCQQNTVAPEGIIEVEAQRMKDAIEAAAAPQKYSRMPSANFLAETGDQTLTQALQEIRIEAVTLSGARNDATRKAAKAKEVADLLASKQGLVGLTTAHQVFTDCEDMRTKIQTKLARFV